LIPLPVINALSLPSASEVAEANAELAAAKIASDAIIESTPILRSSATRLRILNT
jgi:hypothetical protein